MTRLLWIIAPLFFVGCYYDVESELYPDFDCDTPVEVLFGEHVQPLVASQCATPGCHVSGDQSPDLSNYESIKASVDAGSLQSRAIDMRDMPPSGSLPSCEIELIEAWIAQGALNN